MTDAEREQMQFEIEERAAIRHFDGGEPLRDAERNARIEVVTIWQKEKAKERKGK